MPPVGSKRLFIAVKLASGIKDILEIIQKDLRKSEADVKWVEPANIHLTLKFLGNVPEEKFKSAQDALTDLFAKQERFDVTLQELGCFPSLSSPRVVWAGLQDRTGHLKNIALRLEEAFSKFGFEKETREFQAHITLGRVRSPRNKVALIEKIKGAQQSFPPQAFSIDNITLFESRLSPAGPTYSVVHQIKFL